MSFVMLKHNLQSSFNRNGELCHDRLVNLDDGIIDDGTLARRTAGAACPRRCHVAEKNNGRRFGQEKRWASHGPRRGGLPRW